MAEDTPEPLSEAERAFLADPGLVAALDRANASIAAGNVQRRNREHRPTRPEQD